ncbi:MAG TPA: acyl-CoA desaturase [Mycobacteriales bacterium]|nr:acyl-CoA desaturase [Mycobacteriales bacterium]
MAETVEDQRPQHADRSGRSMLAGKRGMAAHVAVYLLVIGPFLALLVAVPVAWGWGLGWVDVVLAVAWYVLTCLGVTVGYHRYFTHGSFKARRGMRVVLAIAGSMAVQGPILHWVADHRRHHAFSDKDGDPHSPWRFGRSPVALVRGFWHAHMGWLFERDLTNQQRFAPDLLADRDIRMVHRLFGLWTAVTLLAPALMGGLVTWSWWGAITAFFWASLVRVTVLHHVTWSVNSICHMIGDRPFAARDRSANVWSLALLSMGESWHNLHHADPTSARHGVRPGQLDISARMIWLFEKLGWVYDVRWPTPGRLARLAATR